MGRRQEKLNNKTIYLLFILDSLSCVLLDEKFIIIFADFLEL